ncbi:hypothetical protein FB446DRAFT_830650 [Lentinula raphanica]|nr:hypothetical protein FB446DRAFT_830650 [Lentinula raphanica]
MPSFIQQPYGLSADPACIPTFDHGLGRTVYVRPPVDRFGQRVRLRQVWLLRRVGGIKWEYYCPCPPPENRPGIPARCYEVRQTSSPYFGNVYLGCGKTRQRCDWRVRLDLVYQAQDQQGHPQQFPGTDDLDDDDHDPALLAAQPSIQNDDAGILPRPLSRQNSSAPVDANDADFEDQKFDEAFAQLMQQLQITGQMPFSQYSEQELAEWLGRLRLNDPGLGEDAISTDSGSQNNQMVWNELEEEWQLPAHAYEDLEMLAAFAGQDDVLVTPDGVIHYIPKEPEVTAAENSSSNNTDSDGMSLGDNESAWKFVLFSSTSIEAGFDPAPESQNTSSKIQRDVTPMPATEFDAKSMFIDLTLDEDFTPPSQKHVVRYLSPVDLTMDYEDSGSVCSQHINILGSGTSAEPCWTQSAVPDWVAAESDRRCSGSSRSGRLRALVDVEALTLIPAPNRVKRVQSVPAFVHQPSPNASHPTTTTKNKNVLPFATILRQVGNPRMGYYLRSSANPTAVQLLSPSSSFDFPALIISKITLSLETPGTPPKS